MTKSPAVTLALALALAANAAAQSPDLTGLWGASLRFGPDRPPLRSGAFHPLRPNCLVYFTMSDRA